MLANALKHGAEALRAFADEMARIAEQAPGQVELRVTDLGAQGDRQEAEAIKRGQRTATIDATRRALGL